jgi:MoxR-like ATPase
VDDQPAHPPEIARVWQLLAREVAKAVVAAESPLRMLATALLAEGHTLVEDVPGVGKTLLARAFARALGLGFARLQGTPDLLPTDVTGSSVLRDGRFEFIPGPIFTNVLLVDEINRATPRTQSALLEAMQERQVSVDAATRPLPEPFLVLATQNPIELEGTFALPEAQLDRFLVRVTLGYPDEDAEAAIARRYRQASEPIDAIQPVLPRERLPVLRDVVRRVAIGRDVERYLIGLVRATRRHPDLRLGASPRASVALYRATQAWAALDGRDYGLPDDVARVAPAVLTHRLMVDVDRELRGATAERVMAEILEEVPLEVVEAPAPTGR